jgi:hypothetical protein
MRETVLEFERLSFGVLNYSELLERLEEVKEIEKNRVNKERADNASKEMRRQQYEKLKAEFGGETD